jgi:hypothetical protein
MELNIRKLNENDWETLCSWWEQWPNWVPVPKHMLPENGTGGFMVEKNNKPIVAGFLYTTNSKVAWVEWVVSDPTYRESDRKEALELLIKGIENVAKNSGFQVILSIGRSRGLIEVHKKLGYTIDKDPSYEISKKIN